jgi:hypothetical protein
MAEGQPKKWPWSISQAMSVSLVKPAWDRARPLLLCATARNVAPGLTVGGSTLYLGELHCLLPAARVAAPRQKHAPSMELKLIRDVPNRLRASACRELG